ncbi:GATA transcription factor 8 [Dichanthelium oligosanthes]|uniref:GATA transcription factor 8 n=1 Tax=Dichanthelium oligosanthes TaxID=888268 RepID=A0A1E5WCG4_9POAL|nr:GATA transcription factor 8 [Dichanthelium oligosanthes]
MASGGFVEEMMREQSLLEATCGDLFDHIDDLLDFPKEDSAADVLLLDAPAPGSPLSARIIDVGGRCNAPSAPQAPPAAMEPLMALPPPAAQDDAAAFFAAAGAPVFDAKDVGGHIGSCEDLDMDMAQLEWLSGLFDDASIPHEPAFPGANCAAPIKSSALAANAGVALLPPDKMEDALFRSSSPISVFVHNSFNANNNVGSASSSSSSASSSSESFSGSGGHAWSAPVSPRPEPPVLVIPARARSKRSRPSAFTGAARAAEAPTILVPTPMYSSTSSHSDPESIAESNPAPPMKKKKAKKPAPPAPAASDADGDNDGDADYEEGSERALPPGTVRRCTHCQIEKTPQWRAGPLGPKTLCNACGVRYKSGRLFPEYRPAASPTFVPSIHSNSHKKVVEMRQKAVRSGDPSCDLLQFIRRRD